MEEIENKIVELLNVANEKLTIDEFSILSESIISYIDDLNK